MILQEILSPVSGFKCVYQKDFTKEIKHRLRGLRADCADSGLCLKRHHHRIANQRSAADQKPAKNKKHDFF